ncbi:MAG: tRNA(Ile)(2)-agmatinylcytidine synthase [Candidatus Bathyarchaeota archaeon]
MVRLHIGFDDTDSPKGGCTTYIAALLVEKFRTYGVTFLDYPNLIRLNPNVQWKTRGNGALCLRIDCPKNKLQKIKEIVNNTINDNSELNYVGTDPGIVFLFGKIPKKIIEFAKKAKKSIISIDKALTLAENVKAETFSFKKGRGIIGGLAAIGESLQKDHTFEIIAYRTPENRNQSRKVQSLSVKNMNEQSPNTFNNIDTETGRILITPRGPDPILCGIRGETPEAVKKAYEMLTIEEPVERWMIFRTNQGTDAHLQRVIKVREIKQYDSVIVQGLVSRKPRIIQGGHVIFSIKDKTGEIDCAAYNPTVSLCKVARKLIIGDFLKVYGGVRPPSLNFPLTINLEKINILNLESKISFINPICPECGKRLKSMGTNQGFKCNKCGFRSSNLTKLPTKTVRGLDCKLYITSPRSQRHLTKPFSRYGKEKTSA